MYYGFFVLQILFVLYFFNVKYWINGMNLVNTFAPKTILTMQRLKPDWSMCLCWGIALSSVNGVRFSLTWTHRLWIEYLVSFSLSLAFVRSWRFGLALFCVLFARIDLFCIWCFKWIRLTTQALFLFSLYKFIQESEYYKWENECL